MAKKKAEPIIVDEIKQVKRRVHFYDINIVFTDDFKPKENEDPFLGFFSIITKMSKDKEANRYVQVQDAQIFVRDVVFDDKQKKIMGKLSYIKMDVFPELIDILTDETNDIETEESKGLVETTHFIIDYSRPQKKIAFEYNHAGGKIADFITYCEYVGKLKKAIRSIDYVLKAKDELSKFKDRIGECSSLLVRVHKDNIENIQGLDNQLYSTIKAVKEQYDAKFIQIKMGFSYKKIKHPQKIRTNINNLLSKLVNNKKNLDYFDVLKISALDRNNNFKMQLFNLLMDKVESEISVERKPKHKVIVSRDIFQKMIDAMRDKKI